MKKRFLWPLILLGVAAFSLVGCGESDLPSGGSNQTGGGSEETGGGSEETGGGSSVEINWDVDLSRPIPLRGLFPNSGMRDFGKDDTAEIIQRETGYRVVYDELAPSGAEIAISNYLATSKEYNFMKLNESCYAPYLESETFLDLTELLEKTPEGRVLYQLIDFMDGAWDAVTYTDDKGEKHIYGIPDYSCVPTTETALVWNTNHLEQIGFEAQYGHKLPETLTEVTWAFEKLQAKFGSNKSYSVFGIPGAAYAEVNPIAACFEVPNEFFVDDDGNVQIKNLSENMEDYVLYMNYLYKKGILASNWNNSSSATVNQVFAQELHSCVYLPYWYVTPLVNAIVDRGTIAQTMGKSNDFQTMHDEAIAWTLRIRGDGYTFENGRTVSCKTQEKAKLPGDPGGVSYYTVIPAYMAENALYVIDYLAKKMEAFAAFFGGDDRHWSVIETPAGAPKPEDYTPETDDLYTQHESFKDMICFVRPYSYSYKDARDGTEKTVTVSEPGKWIRLTDRYKTYIAENSQYCTGTNAIAAKVYCHLHEIGFNAWYYCDNNPDPDEWISNPMFMSPTMKLWAPVNIASRSHFLTGVEHSISVADPAKELDINIKSAYAKKAASGGKVYFYWSDEVSAEMTAWYNANRKNK